MLHAGPLKGRFIFGATREGLRGTTAYISMQALQCMQNPLWEMTHTKTSMVSPDALPQKPAGGVFENPMCEVNRAEYQGKTTVKRLSVFGSERRCHGRAFLPTVP